MKIFAFLGSTKIVFSLIFLLFSTQLLNLRAMELDLTAEELALIKTDDEDLARQRVARDEADDRQLREAIRLSTEEAKAQRAEASSLPATEDETMARVLALSAKEEEERQQRVAAEDAELSFASAASLKSLPKPLRLQTELEDASYETCDQRYRDSHDFEVPMPSDAMRGAYVTIKQLPVLFQGYKDLREGLYSEQNLCGYYALYNTATTAAFIAGGERGGEDSLLSALNNRKKFEDDVLRPASEQVTAKRAENKLRGHGASDIGTYSVLSDDELVNLCKTIPCLGSISAATMVLYDATVQESLIREQCQKLLSGRLQAISFVIPENQDHWIAAILKKMSGSNSCEILIFDSLARDRSQLPCITQLAEIVNSVVEFRRVSESRRLSIRSKALLYLMGGIITLCSSIYFGSKR